MITIKAPAIYVNEPGIITRTGNYVSRYGKRGLIIAGKRALASKKGQLFFSLRSSGMEYQTLILEGAPTERKAEEFLRRISASDTDFVIGAGGGRVCDFAKLIGNKLKKPIVMIPTIAATCACWAARSVLYQEDATFDHIQWNEESPECILADTDILLHAPKRYLASGIMDTYAKWYEFYPLLKNRPDDLVLLQGVASAKMAFEILNRYESKAITGTLLPAEEEKVVDAIFYLAGVIGSFENGHINRGLAHAFYYAAVQIPESHHLLHGELVAFGLLVQLVLRESLIPRNSSDTGNCNNAVLLQKLTGDLLALGITETPYDWNLENKEKTIREISRYILAKTPSLQQNGFTYNPDTIEQAIHEASRFLIRQRGKVQNGETGNTGRNQRTACVQSV